MTYPLTQPINNNHLLSTEDINRLDVIRFEGIIHYIDTDEKLDLCALPLVKHVGFDTETRPSFKKNLHYDISLIQIATDEEAFLFHISKIKNNKKIFDYLRDTSITKIGAGIDDDLRKLNNKAIPNLNKISFLDIQKLAKKLHLPKSNLKYLTAVFLNRRIIKSSQTSNWDRHPLTEKQKLYAATDAWVCLKIFNEMNKILETLQ
ncbi:MAG: 3'-5' exonuclease domain-containing protein 2 [Calditerrivibrio sp.]|nr:3'-5' exonuclease domain-containing protein 2 [Calditerrivibrio sp.]